MGSRFGALTVPEALLPWHGAGVRYLLRAAASAEESAADAASEAPAQEYAPEAVEPPSPPENSSIPPALAAASDDARRQESPSSPAATRRASGPAYAPPSSASNPSRSAGAGYDPEPPTTEQGSDWPAPWDAFLAKTCQPCSALFTYLELGLDLGGQPSAERRGLFADIIGALRNKAGWPRGCVSFWPMAVPSPNDPSGLTVDIDMFWRGAAHIKPRFVCLFGRAAWQALYPGRRFIIGPLRASGHSLLVLPGPEEMLPDNKQVKGVVWNSLRSLGISG